MFTIKGMHNNITLIKGVMKTTLNLCYILHRTNWLLFNTIKLIALSVTGALYLSSGHSRHKIDD